MKISELYNGCTVMHKPEFKWNKLDSWMGPLIIFFENIWNRILKRPLCPVSHAITIVETNGIIYAYEAVKRYTRTPVQERFVNENLSKYIVLIPKFKIINPLEMSQAAENLVGDKYNFVGTCWDEFVNEVTDKRVWVGARKITNRVFCTEADAYLDYIGTNKYLFQEYYKTDPVDKYNDTLFKHESLEL
jgi:hypothetical protein